MSQRSAPAAPVAIESSAIVSLSRPTDADSSSLRPGASPSQNGIVGGWPCASAT